MWGNRVFKVDDQVSSVFEEIAFTHERQAAEFEFTLGPSVILCSLSVGVNIASVVSLVT